MRLRRLTTTVAAAALVVPLFGAIAQAEPAATPDGLRLVATRDSQLATHYWYVQTLAGHRVLGGYYAKHVDKKTGAVTVDDGRVALTSQLATAAPRVTAAQAERSAPGQVRSTEVAVLPDGGAKLVYSVVSNAGRGSVRTIVDAGTGAVLKTENLVKEVNGTGAVFSPNPVASLQNE